MTSYPPPSRDQQHRFLTSFLFGGSPEPAVREAVWRAYLDLSRTIHGIGTVTRGVRESAHGHVENLVSELLLSGPRAAAGFDRWHRASCLDLCNYFGAGGYDRFTVGQSQKWINMAVKYSLTLAAVGWLEVKRIEQLRSVSHAPVDALFLEGLQELQTLQPMPRLSKPWSRVTNYDEYFQIQIWLRNSFSASPLDVEFHVWQEMSARRRRLPI